MQKFTGGGYSYDKGTGTALSRIRGFLRTQGDGGGDICETSRGSAAGTDDALYGGARKSDAGRTVERGQEDQRRVENAKTDGIGSVRLTLPVLDIKKEGDQLTLLLRPRTFGSIRAKTFLGIVYAEFAGKSSGKGRGGKGASKMANAEMNTVGAFVNGSQSLRGSAPAINSASKDSIRPAAANSQDDFMAWAKAISLSCGYMDMLRFVL